MNARESAERLPQPVRKLLEKEPASAPFAASGMKLEDVLSSPDWAAAWSGGADPLLTSMLRWILLQYGAIPFEEEKTETEAIRQGSFTGAEWRVGLLRLRRAGVLFAIRKTWGDRLYYVPADMVPVWQRLLLPVGGVPLSLEAARSVRPDPSPFRLPLSLELLQVWSHIRKNGISLTAKGEIPKPAAAKIFSGMRLTAEELAPLALKYPHPDKLPAPAALALDLGLHAGVLRLSGKQVDVSREGARAWMKKCGTSADSVLHRTILEKYVSSNPALHLAASAVLSRAERSWHRESDLVRSGFAAAAADAWLGLLAAFGWAERGTCGEERVYRLSFPLGGDPSGVYASEPWTVQSDAEILVPPGTGLEARWELEEIAERVVSDRVFVYRLTRSSAASSHAAGWTRQAVEQRLERGSGEALPGEVRKALADWYGSLGKVSLQEAVLLRTDSPETAGRLREDPEIAPWLAEPLGSRDFIVPRSRLKALEARLEKIGLPPVSPEPAVGTTPPEDGPRRAPGGWIHDANELSVYEPDPVLTPAGDLFPGMAEVPAAWLSRPGIYHASTRLELIRRAIGWRTAVRIGAVPDPGRLFVPEELRMNGPAWEVSGRWRMMDGRGESGHSSACQKVTLTPDMLGELMIVVPASADPGPRES